MPVASRTVLVRVQKVQVRLPDRTLLLSVAHTSVKAAHGSDCWLTGSSAWQYFLCAPSWHVPCLDCCRFLTWLPSCQWFCLPVDALSGRDSTVLQAGASEARAQPATTSRPSPRASVQAFL